MTTLLLGKKLGMTRVYVDKGVAVPVTAIQVGPCVVTQLRTKEKDGYTAVQIGFEEVAPRNSTIPVIGHDHKAGTTPKRYHREFRVNEKDLAAFTLGQTLTVAGLEKVAYVDVAGTSKGKGFAGTMKRHHFKGLFASHGTERKHRSPGSIGSLCSNRGFGGGLAKGKKMAGHMGAERVTARSLDVVRIDPEKNLLLVKGPIPGPNNGMVEVRTAVRLYKTKGKKQAEVAGK
ncbi:MAG TPA: 50S ribosomal protein L3 [Phycisphaerales bacterium]|nr:50S ribosomal protein L3 [Phycisphaerales bacterium]